MFKQIVHIILRFIFRPAEGWKERDVAENHQSFQRNFLYPVIAFVSVFSFIAIFFSHKSFDMELALKTLILTFFTLLGGLYVSAWLLSEVNQRFFSGEKDLPLFLRFAGYACSPLYLIMMLVALLPSLIFLYVFVFYVAVVVWEGTRNYLSIGADKQTTFTVAATFILLFTPFLLRGLLKIMLPGLQI